MRRKRCGTERLADLISFRLSEAEAECLSDLADHDGCTMSTLLRQAVADYLSRRTRGVTNKNTVTANEARPVFCLRVAP